MAEKGKSSPAILNSFFPLTLPDSFFCWTVNSELWSYTTYTPLNQLRQRTLHLISAAPHFITAQGKVTTHGMYIYYLLLPSCHHSSLLKRWTASYCYRLLLRLHYMLSCVCICCTLSCLLFYLCCMLYCLVTLHVVCSLRSPEGRQFPLNLYAALDETTTKKNLT